MKTTGLMPTLTTGEKEWLNQILKRETCTSKISPRKKREKEVTGEQI
jgi:hypothetical protein